MFVGIDDCICPVSFCWMRLSVSNVKSGVTCTESVKKL